MCDVAGLILGGLSVAGSVASARAQNKAAEEQAEYQNRLYSETGDAALQNYAIQIDAIQDRLGQETAAASQQATLQSSAIQSQQATARVAAGERGVEGNSVELLLQDFTRLEAQTNLDFQTNLQWMADQAGDEMQALQADGQNQINAVTPRPVSGADPLATGIGVIGSLLSITDSALQRQQQGPYNPNNRNPIFQPLMRRKVTSLAETATGAAVTGLRAGGVF
jgi:hypothetical protein